MKGSIATNISLDGKQEKLTIYILCKSCDNKNTNRPNTKRNIENVREIKKTEFNQSDRGFNRWEHIQRIFIWSHFLDKPNLSHTELNTFHPFQNIPPIQVTFSDLFIVRSGKLSIE